MFCSVFIRIQLFVSYGWRSERTTKCILFFSLFYRSIAVICALIFTTATYHFTLRITGPSIDPVYKGSLSPPPWLGRGRGVREVFHNLAGWWITLSYLDYFLIAFYAITPELEGYLIFCRYISNRSPAPNFIDGSITEPLYREEMCPDGFKFHFEVLYCIYFVITL